MDYVEYKRCLTLFCSKNNELENKIPEKTIIILVLCINKPGLCPHWSTQHLKSLADRFHRNFRIVQIGKCVICDGFANRWQTLRWTRMLCTVGGVCGASATLRAPKTFDSGRHLLKIYWYGCFGFSIILNSLFIYKYSTSVWFRFFTI